jgi:Mor family transcriptional regulator
MRGRGVKKKEKAEIREKFRNGAKVHVLAEEHHLSARTIYRIISETRRGNKKKG